MAATTCGQLTGFGMPGRTAGSSALSPGRVRRADEAAHRRGQLRLVPGGAVGASHPGAGGCGPPTAGHPGMALTRRGRLAVTLLVAAVVITLAATMWSFGAPAVPTVDHTTTVTSGQTLWQIATEQMPGVPTRQAVNQLQLTNKLSSSGVHAGQLLQIPAMP